MGLPTEIVAPYATIDSQTGRFAGCGRSLLQAVLLHDGDPRTELLVSIDAESVITLRLFAHDIEAGGSADARVVRFDDDSTLVAASVPLVGYDLDTDALVTGVVEVGLTWTSNTRIADLTLEGGAVLQPGWAADRMEFSAVRRHPFNYDRSTGQQARHATTP